MLIIVLFLMFDGGHLLSNGVLYDDSSVYNKSMIHDQQNATRVFLVLPYFIQPDKSYNLTVIAVDDSGQIDSTYNETITIYCEELRLAKARTFPYDERKEFSDSGYQIVETQYVVEIENGEGIFIYEPQYFMVVNYRVHSDRSLDSISTFLVGITVEG